jgi:hypothetical protein
MKYDPNGVANLKTFSVVPSIIIDKLINVLLHWNMTLLRPPPRLPPHLKSYIILFLGSSLYLAHKKGMLPIMLAFLTSYNAKLEISKNNLKFVLGMLTIVMLTVVLPTVIMLTVVMLTVVILNVMLSVIL